MRAKKLNAILATALSVALLCLFVFPIVNAANDIPATPAYTMSIDKFRAAMTEGSNNRPPAESPINGTGGDEFTWTAGDVIWVGIAITKDREDTVVFPIDSNGIHIMEMAIDYNGTYLSPYTDIEAELTSEEIAALGADPSEETKWAAIVKKYNIGTDIVDGWDANYEIIEIVTITDATRENPLPEGIDTMAHMTIAKKDNKELTNPKLQGMNGKQYLFKLPFKINSIPGVGDKSEVLKLTREPDYLSMQDLGSPAFKSSWMRTNPETGQASENLSNWIKYAGDPSIFGLKTVVPVDPSSPLGAILGDPNMSEADKNKAEDIFKDEHIINKGTSEEKYYNPKAWDDPTNPINYDHDPTTVVTEIASGYALEAVADSKKPDKAYDSANDEVPKENIYTVIIDSNGDVFVPGDHTDPIANMGVYTIEYHKDKKEGEILATRPLVVLVELGDIDMNTGIAIEDANALYNINKIPRTYTGTYQNLYKYRVADINQDGVVNSIDANHIQAQIDYIDGSHNIKQLYTIGGGQ